jgi:hypothetical protein
LEFDYKRLVAAPVSTVWDVLTDPVAMEPHMPGTAKVVSTEQDGYRVSMKMPMGFLRPTINADVRLSDVDKPRSFTIGLSGKAMGAGVAGSAEVSLSTTIGQDSSTQVAMIGVVTTSGLLAKVPDSKIEAAAAGFLESYFSSVERAVAAS